VSSKSTRAIRSIARRLGGAAGAPLRRRRASTGICVGFGIGHADREDGVLVGDDHVVHGFPARTQSRGMLKTNGVPRAKTRIE
jgi:hypothetical protein